MKLEFDEKIRKLEEEHENAIDILNEDLRKERLYMDDEFAEYDEILVEKDENIRVLDHDLNYALKVIENLKNQPPAFYGI